MQVKPIKTQPTFGWSIYQQCTRYGSNMVKSTEYHRDSGVKLLIIDTWKDGKRKTQTKELYNKAWHLVKQKVYKFVNGKKELIKNV